MSEQPIRQHIEAPSREDGSREWEIFIRPDQADPLRHAGSVTAPSADVAHEHASRLLTRDVQDVWVALADEMHRYSAYELASGDRLEQLESDLASQTRDVGE